MAGISGPDAQILDELQRSFPLTERPFAEVASSVGLTEPEVIARTRALRESGILRQLSAIFDTRRLGYKSSLVAMRVRPGSIERVAGEINRHPGVSHNYERDGKYNLWFTIAVPPGSSLKAELDGFAGIEGIEAVRMLPTIRLFKIGVRLEVAGKLDVRPTERAAPAPRAPFTPTERDKEIVRETQKDLELVERPFEGPARRLGMTEGELFGALRHYEKIGVMRRFAAILRHRDAGFVANGMIVWKVPEGRIEEVGATLGAFPQVSHCYQRPTYDDWPYNVFSMIHCKTREEADGVVERIREEIGVDEYRVLFSLREFKKTRVEYFVEGREAPVAAAA